MSLKKCFRPWPNTSSAFERIGRGIRFGAGCERLLTAKRWNHFRRQQGRPQAAGGTVAQHRMAEVPDMILDEVDDEPAEQNLFLRALELIRKDFHEKTWLAFWRVVVDGQSPKDVAQELDMRPGTVRVAKSRVLHRLRRELGELLD